MADDQEDGHRPGAAMMAASALLLAPALVYVFVTYGLVAGFALWGMGAVIWFGMLVLR